MRLVEAVTTAGSRAAAIAHDDDLSGPTLPEVRNWPATVSVRRASAALGWSPSWSYELLARNEFPCRVIKIGSRARVVTASLIALLEGGDTS